MGAVIDAPCWCRLSLCSGGHTFGLARRGHAIGSVFCSGSAPASTCPCSNGPGTDEGCAKSTGSGLRLEATGSASLANDDLSLVTRGFAQTSPALLFSGSTALGGGSGISFGDDLRRVGGSIVRHQIRFAEYSGSVFWSQGLAAQSSWAPMDSVHFQVRYRYSVNSACGSLFNLSNALTVRVTP